MDNESLENSLPSPIHKILVIDDDENYRDVITMSLQLSDYTVFTATNGLDGLAATKMHHPDLILCDINMPKMDGHALLAALKQEPEFAEIPFIFLTGNAAHSDMRKGMQLGADDYLTKPFSGEELLSAVKIRLNKKHLLKKYYESRFDDIKSNILHSLPHEFRTPLNSVLGFSQILKEETNLPPDEVQEMGELIYRSGKRLHHLLENVVLYGQLQFLKNDRTKIEQLRNESASTITEVIHSVSEKQMILHERMGAVLYKPGETILVAISSIHLTKLMEEILDNALKFSEAGTSVIVVTEVQKTDATITISDNGRGLSEEQIHRISAFQQFERNYYEQQGAGLGLAIARTILDIYNGSLIIESTLTKGTTVKLSLPIAANT